MASMYVRVKRKQTTLFLHVEPADTVAQVKGKIQELVQAAPAQQRLLKGGTPLEDSASLAELKIETDDVLELALQRPDGSWDDPGVVDYDANEAAAS